MRRLALAGVLALAACSPVYHHGVRGDHFDGRRFFNPEGQGGTGGSQHEPPFQYLRRVAKPRHHWPAIVPVTPSVPPARVAGEAMRVTWVGHSTVLVQTQGRNILTDPIWSDRAFPVQWAGPKRVRAPGIAFDDLPRIDVVLLSHDHYDHFDAPTLQRLWRRDHPAILTGLGNDERLARFGIPAQAGDWGQTITLRGLRITIDRAHHWSRRWLKDRNATLWTGFTIHLPGGDVFYAGDTGPGDLIWAREAAALGPVRLAILPIGAIHANGVVTGNHIDPAGAVAAFGILWAGSALGVHWGTFELTDEPIDLPPRLLAQATAAAHLAPGRFRVIEPGVAWEVPRSSPSPLPR